MGFIRRVRLRPELLGYDKNYGGGSRLLSLWNLEAGADYENRNGEHPTVAWSLFWFMENSRLATFPTPRVPNLEEL